MTIKTIKTGESRLAHPLPFADDLRIFGTGLGEALSDVATQVAAVGSLPEIGKLPTVEEARAHLLAVAAHLCGEGSYVGSPFETHALSVVGRAMRIATTLAIEDLGAERDGSSRPTILTADQWRMVHRGIVAGCSGAVPVMRAAGTLQPPRWIIDVLQLTGRLAEVGGGPAEASIRRRALASPSASDQTAAAELAAAARRRKADGLRANPEAAEAARLWTRLNRIHLAPTPRPAGHLAVDDLVHIKLGAAYRTPAESQACEQERRERERNEAGQTRLVLSSRAEAPLRADKEVADILRDNRRKGVEFARSSGCSRNRSMG